MRFGGRRLVAAWGPPALLALAALGAGPACAGEAAPTNSAANADAVDARLLEYGPSGVALQVLQFGPVLLGAAFALVMLIRWQDRRATGAPAPPTNSPLVPFGGVATLLLALVGLAVLPVVPSVLFISHFGVELEALPIWAKVIIGLSGTLPVAILVVTRRHRMVHTPPALRLTRAGIFAPPAGAVVSSAPGLRPAFGLGFRTVCLAALAVLPVGFVWAEILTALGKEHTLQKTVVEVLTSPSMAVPWLIAVFGVFVAPFVEECFFRGLLYPALKRTFGGGRAGAWAGNVLASFLFALVHESWFALLPLFALAVVLTVVFERTNSLAALVIAHALHNLFALVPLMLYKVAH